MIYKVRKLDSHGLAQDHQLDFNYQQQHIAIWGQKRSIRQTSSVQIEDKSFYLHQLAPKDSVVGLCEVLHVQVQRDELRAENTLEELLLSLDGSPASHSTHSNSLQCHLHQQLLANGLQPTYARSQFPGREELESGLYIKRIDPLYGPFSRQFPRQQLGILVFLNGEEPAHGSIGLDDITVTPGDQIQVVYIATRWGKQWRPGQKQSQQLDLF